MTQNHYERNYANESSHRISASESMLLIHRHHRLKRRSIRPGVGWWSERFPGKMTSVLCVSAERRSPAIGWHSFTSLAHLSFGECAPMPNLWIGSKYMRLYALYRIHGWTQGTDYVGIEWRLIRIGCRKFWPVVPNGKLGLIVNMDVLKT